MVISDAVFRAAGLAEDALPQREVFVAGREGPIRVWTATTTADLSAAISAIVAAAAA